MTTPILTTKLYIPAPRSKRVQRQRLLSRLNEGRNRKLTLVSAPAGFGKTMLVSDWATSSQQPFAWLSLDAGDNDPTRFMSYFVSALQTVLPDVGAGTLAALQSPQPLPVDVMLTALINEINGVEREVYLVLDDYHILNAQLIDEMLSFLLEHLPPQMHLVIITREDPPLPLARLRVRGELTELRIADLRFTAAEAAEFLNQVMVLNLSAEEVAALDTRTEGWIAGLQMAAISMEGRADTTRFIQAFTGSHRFVLDYLVEEVLQRQPPRIRDFLLQTSILNRLSGSLCDAVTGHDNGQETLEALERGNMLIIPLDDERQWYRYHHLFADVLQAHALEAHPEQIATLHGRASVWHEHNHLLADAVRHALTAEDWQRAGGLVERVWPQMRRTRQEATLVGWVDALPEDLIRMSPVLSVVCAWVLLDAGRLDAVEAHLQIAERWLYDPPPGDMIVVDERQFASLPASIANARAYRAQALDDMTGTVAHTQRALDLLPEDDYYERGTTSALLGLAHWASGDLNAAYVSFAGGLENLQKGGGIVIMIGGTMVLGKIKQAQGRLREAVHVYQRALQLATAQPGTLLQGTPELHLGLAELYHERGDLDAARQELQHGQTLREQASLPGYEYLWDIVGARLAATGDLDRALDLLREAERHYYRSPIPDVRPISAMTARLWLQMGQLGAAQDWVRARGLSLKDEANYLREYEHLTLARVCIAQAQQGSSTVSLAAVLGLLDRLLALAEAKDRTGSLLEILITQALVYAAQDDPAALEPLQRALTLAEPEEHVRLFLDDGPPMVALLDAAAQQGIAPAYVHRLLTAFGEADNATPVLHQLIDPLTEREWDVLRMLRTELSGPEIAEELSVSLNTLRSHIKNIYAKLGVHNRRAAVRRAEELSLF